MADLSVIIVNYNSGWFCANLVDSLLDQRFTNAGGDPGTLEIIVLDNASPTDQRAFLDPLKDRVAEVIWSDENRGYGGGNNQAMERVTSDWVMVVNPDVVLLDGAIQKMLDLLYVDPRVGIVGPRGWFDPAFHFFLPPIEMPRPGAHLHEILARMVPFLGRRFSLARSRYALNYWTGHRPLDADMISGYCFIMATALAREFGPFDLDFPFYYEDSDLSMRLGKAGYRRVYLKEARVLHFYNKSAGPVFDEVIRKYHRSKSHFFQKHYGRWARRLVEGSTAFLQKHADRLRADYFKDCRDLGVLDSPLELDFPENRPLLLELTLDPAFVLAAGHFHPGGPYRMPLKTWEALDPNLWYLRVLDRDARESLTVYRWEKRTPGLLPPPYATLREDAP